MNTMTLGTSTLLVAVGAIMRYAITAEGDGFNVGMIGAILMIVGIVGAVISIAMFASSSSGRRAVVSGATGARVVEEREVVEVRDVL